MNRKTLSSRQLTSICKLERRQQRASSLLQCIIKSEDNAVLEFLDVLKLAGYQNIVAEILENACECFQTTSLQCNYFVLFIL